MVGGNKYACFFPYVSQVSRMTCIPLDNMWTTSFKETNKGILDAMTNQ